MHILLLQTSINWEGRAMVYLYYYATEQYGKLSTLIYDLCSKNHTFKIERYRSCTGIVPGVSLLQKLIGVQQTLIRIIQISTEKNHFPIQEKPNNPISVNFFFFFIQSVEITYPIEKTCHRNMDPLSY